MKHHKLKQMNYIAITTVLLSLHFVEGMFPMPLAIPDQAWAGKVVKL